MINFLIVLLLINTSVQQVMLYATVTELLHISYTRCSHCWTHHQTIL